MTRILALIERIYRHYFKCIYLKNKRLVSFLIVFLDSTLNIEHFPKKRSYSLNISEFIDFKRRGYLKA